MKICAFDYQRLHCNMKNIVTFIIALLLSLQAQAAIHTVKFVNADGKEPAMQHYDQHCQLVDCDDNTIIRFNNIQLVVGDQLVIETPKLHGFLSCFGNYQYTINYGSTADVTDLKTICEMDRNAEDNLFFDLHFDAVAVGTDAFDLRFTSNNYNSFVQSPDALLGHVRVTVTK